MKMTYMNIFIRFEDRDHNLYGVLDSILQRIVSLILICNGYIQFKSLWNTIKNRKCMIMSSHCWHGNRVPW